MPLYTGSVYQTLLKYWWLWIHSKISWQRVVLNNVANVNHTQEEDCIWIITEAHYKVHKFITFHPRTIQTFGNHCCYRTLLEFCSCARYCYAIMKHITNRLNKPSGIRVQDFSTFVFSPWFFWTSRLHSWILWNSHFSEILATRSFNSWTLKKSGNFIRIIRESWVWLLDCPSLIFPPKFFWIIRQ
jgi:hypothetical protein